MVHLFFYVLLLSLKYTKLHVWTLPLRLQTECQTTLCWHDFIVCSLFLRLFISPPTTAFADFHRCPRLINTQTHLLPGRHCDAVATRIMRSRACVYVQKSDIRDQSRQKPQAFQLPSPETEQRPANMSHPHTPYNTHTHTNCVGLTDW